MRSTPNVCAVVVTYRPDESIAANLAALRPQVDGVVIVDNASPAEIQPLLRQVAADNSATLICNPENFGLARALNQGIRHAEEHGYDWVVIFDQDSTVGENYIETIMRVYENSPDAERIAIVSPQFMDRKSGETIHCTLYHKGEPLCTMASGSLVRTETYRRIGYHEEDLFTYYVDTEWCLRARRMGMVVRESPDATLLHSLGDLTYHRLFCHNIPVTNHSVGRRYYIERNRWHLYLSGKYEWAWVIRDFYWDVTSFFAILLYEENRWPKMKSIVLGFCDAWRGRMNKRVDP